MHIKKCAPIIFCALAFALMFVGCTPQKRDAKIVGIKVYSLDQTVEVFIKEIKELGINTVFAGKELCCKNGFIDSVQNTGIDVFVIWPVFYQPEYLAKHSDAFAIDQWGNRAKDEWVEFVCPTNKEFKEYLAKEIKSFLTNHHPKGISLDFIRHFVYWEKVYPGTNPQSIPQTCSCPNCVQQFIEHLSNKKHIDTSGCQFVLSKYYNEWNAWRTDLISQTTAWLVLTAKTTAPDIKINIHAVPWYSSDFGGLGQIITGQNIDVLSEYADYISPMCYAHMIKQTPGWIEKITGYLYNGCKNRSETELSEAKTTYFLKCLIRKVQVQGLPLLKIKEFTFVNDCFQEGRNAEIGLSVQALYKKNPEVKIIPSIQVQREYLSNPVYNSTFKMYMKHAVNQYSSGIVFWSWEALKQNPDKMEAAKEFINNI